MVMRTRSAFRIVVTGDSLNVYEYTIAVARLRWGDLRNAFCYIISRVYYRLCCLCARCFCYLSCCCRRHFVASRTNERRRTALSRKPMPCWREEMQCRAVVHIYILYIYAGTNTSIYAFLTYRKRIRICHTSTTSLKAGQPKNRSVYRLVIISIG